MTISVPIIDVQVHPLFWVLDLCPGVSPTTFRLGSRVQQVTGRGLTVYNIETERESTTETCLIKRGKGKLRHPVRQKSKYVNVFIRDNFTKSVNHFTKKKRVYTEEVTGLR